MITIAFEIKGWVLFGGGLLTYGLYIYGIFESGKPMPLFSGGNPITIEHKHQTYNMLLYRAGFLFAHKILVLLERFVKNSLSSSEPADRAN